MNVKELAEQTGKSRGVIYKLCNRLGRLPTIEEINGRKSGRPLKFKSEEE